MRFGIALVLTFLVAATAPVIAAEVTLSLDSIPGGIPCGETFNEGACQMWFTNILTSDCQAAEPVEICFIAVQPTGVFIMPARLVVDLSSIEGIETISVDVTEGFDPGCTRVMLYESGNMIYLTSSSGTGAQTIDVSTVGIVFDSLIIAGWESAVWEIRLYGSNLVGNDARTFGTLKALYH
jgi:hypothetical protein